MSVDLATWIPKYIQNLSAYKAGDTPTAEELNAFINLLIAQGNDTTAVVQYITETGLTDAFATTVQPLIDAINASLANGDFIGAQGPLGPTGNTGPAGLQGVQGVVGPQGNPGPQGPDGQTGPAGADGLNGADGADGVVSVTQNEFAFFVKDGHLYLVTDDTATVSTTAYIDANGHLIIVRDYPEEV